MDEQDREQTPPAGEPTSAGGEGAAGAAGVTKEGATVSRSQHVVHVLPQDWSMIGQVLTPALERVDGDLEATQVLVLTRDPASSLAVADAALGTRRADEGVEILPVTSVRRAARLSTERAPLAIAATPADASALIASSALKLDRVRTLVLAWLDDVLEDPASTGALEAVMAEVPKDAARVVIASSPSPALDAFVERYMRRARRLEDQPLGEPLPRPVEFVTAPENGRPGALHRVLDELDPATTVIRTRTELGSAEARRALQRLGYASREAVRVVGEGEPADAELVVLYELPERREALRAVLDGTTGRVVALVEPRQLVTLRRLAGASSAQPFALAAGALRARERQARLLGDLEARLTTERVDRELLALEPLVGAYDGLEIAAALLRMLDDEQARAESRMAEVINNAALARAAEQPAPAVVTGAPEAPSGWARVFVNVGERDGASPGDLVGAITGEAGVQRDVIGKIELRESFTIVEIASAVADNVIERLSGAMVRGRRVQARLDRGGRDAGDRGRPERGASRGPARGGFDRGGFDRGGRGGGFDRGGRGGGFDRGDRGERGERGSRGGGFDRGGRSFDRPARSFERGDRGQRTDRGERGPRPGYDRGERGDRGDRGDRGGYGGRGGGYPDRGGYQDRGSRGPAREERGGRSFDRGDRGDRADRGERGGFGRDRDRGYGRTLDDERQEWRQRGERLRRARGDVREERDDRRPRDEEGGPR